MLVGIEKELLKSFWSPHPASISFELLRNKEAIKDGEARKIKDRDEECSDGPRNYKNDERRNEGLLDNLTTCHCIHAGQLKSEIRANSHDQSLTNGCHDPA